MAEDFRGGRSGHGSGGMRNACKMRSTIPVAKTILILGILGAFVYVIWFFLGKKEREARALIDSMTPVTIAETLFAGRDLPKDMAMEVEGILDLRMAHFDFQRRPDRSYAAYDYESVRVYGLFFPKDSGLDDYTDRLHSLAKIVLAGVSASDDQLSDEMYFENYKRSLAKLERTFEEMSARDAILVELDEGLRPDFVKAARTRLRKQSEDLKNSVSSKLDEYRSENSGKAIKRALEEHAEIAKHILNEENLKAGVFKIELVEHNKKVAASYKQKGTFRIGTKIVRTIREVGQE